MYSEYIRILRLKTLGIEAGCKGTEVVAQQVRVLAALPPSCILLHTTWPLSHLSLQSWDITPSSGFCGQSVHMCCTDRNRQNTTTPKVNLKNNLKSVLVKVFSTEF